MFYISFICRLDSPHDWASANFSPILFLPAHILKSESIFAKNCFVLLAPSETKRWCLLNLFYPNLVVPSFTSSYSRYVASFRMKIHCSIWSAGVSMHPSIFLPKLHKLHLSSIINSQFHSFIFYVLIYWKKPKRDFTDFLKHFYHFHRNFSLHPHQKKPYALASSSCRIVAFGRFRIRNAPYFPSDSSFSNHQNFQILFVSNVETAHYCFF